MSSARVVSWAWAMHSVAVPFDKARAIDDKLLLQGFTKGQIKDLPEVEIAK